MLKAGVVGLPTVGKSTLFNALTRSHKAEAANYPFCTIDPNFGVVNVPDERLAPLSRIAHIEARLARPVQIGRNHEPDIAGNALPLFLRIENEQSAMREVAAKDVDRQS